MTDLLYRWPEAARFNRVVAKTKFYEQGTVSAAVRERFVAEVERITWAYKLAEETINLPASEAVPEIQVLVIEARGRVGQGGESEVADVSNGVLAAIDKAIRQPVIFEITRRASVEPGQARVETRMTATTKQVGARVPKLGVYYSTGWIAVDRQREPLPTAISLAGLYAALLEPLTTLRLRLGEEISDVAARLGAVHRLEREVTSLERKLRTEPQLNRKVELRRRLKDRRAALESLM